MKVSSPRLDPAGGIHVIPLPVDFEARLLLCGFGVVGPDPPAALREAHADAVVCLLTDHDIDLWYPSYAGWLTDPAPAIAVHAPTPDYDVVADDEFDSTIGAVIDLLAAGTSVLAHCGAGIGRAGSLAVGVSVTLGDNLRPAIMTVRQARPGAGPQSDAQDAQLRRLAQRLGRDID